ncbi:RICIN domain-containing protein [Streptomyces sp. NPDC090442]|uniref:RICIN domain-containing protein n=1 Tax=Streptomyces sp. NPDC090442 TaxID=3365962 RepID=UPI0037FDEF0A
MLRRIAATALAAAALTAGTVLFTPNAQAAGGLTWTITATGGKCVDVEGMSSANGATVQQYTCNSTPAQKFSLRYVNDDVLEIRTFANKCMDVQNRSSADGTRIQQYGCNGTPAQKFTPRQLDTRPGTAQFVTFAGKCLTADGSPQTEAAPMRQQPCDENNPAQQFRLTLG